MADLAGTEVLVVGGARGIGRATCRQLLAAGCRLAVADRDLSALADLRREAEDGIATVGLDLTDRGRSPTRRGSGSAAATWTRSSCRPPCTPPIRPS